MSERLETEDCFASSSHQSFTPFWDFYMSTSSNVKVVPLAYKVLLQTDGSANERHFEIDQSSIRSFGPHLMGIRFHTLTESATTNFAWTVTAIYSIDGIVWSAHDTTSRLFTPITSASPAMDIQAEFTDGSKLGLKMRYFLTCFNNTGSAVESAVVTVAGAFRFSD
jgi:hypothetical protein